MKKGVVIIMAFAMTVLGTVRAFAQFTPEELAERPKWEESLRTAEIVKQDQLRGDEAVTNPWKLALKSGEVVRDALWKNPLGKMGGYLEGWPHGIAPYP